MRSPAESGLSCTILRWIGVSLSAKSWLESQQTSGRLATTAQRAILAKVAAAKESGWCQNIIVLGGAHRQGNFSSRQLWTCRFHRISRSYSEHSIFQLLRCPSRPGSRAERLAIRSSTACSISLCGSDCALPSTHDVLHDWEDMCVSSCFTLSDSEGLIRIGMF